MPVVTRRNLYICLDGTCADRVSSDKDSVVVRIDELIPNDDRNITIYVEGVGNAVGFREKYLGAAVGKGLERNVAKAYFELVQFITRFGADFNIIIIGFSRGAYTARSLAGLIARVGVPRVRNHANCRALCKDYFDGTLRKKPRRAERLKRKYDCLNLEIAALACFDTVGTLGIPKTGILAFMKLFNFVTKKLYFHDTDLAPNVKRAYHALAAHERRKPFRPTLMHIPEGDDSRVLKQVWFLGAHGDLGWDDLDGGLVDIPLAWMLQQLKDAVGVEYDKEALANRFPRSTQAPQPANGGVQDLVNEPPRRTGSGLMSLLGNAARKPGGYARPGMVTNEEIHMTVRLKAQLAGAGQSSPLAGFRLQEGAGPNKWMRVKRDGTLAADGLKEAPLGEFEAKLLGLAPQ